MSCRSSNHHKGSYENGMKIWLHFVIQDGKNLPGNMHNIDNPKNNICRYGNSDSSPWKTA